MLYLSPSLQEWVPIIRHDLLSQRKMKAQPPLSDAYLHGMPAKRRKVRCLCHRYIYIYTHTHTHTLIHMLTHTPLHTGPPPILHSDSLHTPDIHDMQKAGKNITLMILHTAQISAFMGVHYRCDNPNRCFMCDYQQRSCKVTHLACLQSTSSKWSVHSTQHRLTQLIHSKTSTVDCQSY